MKAALAWLLLGLGVAAVGGLIADLCARRLHRWC